MSVWGAELRGPGWGQQEPCPLSVFAPAVPTGFLGPSLPGPLQCFAGDTLVGLRGARALCFCGAQSARVRGSRRCPVLGGCPAGLGQGVRIFLGVPTPQMPPLSQVVQLLALA